MTREELFKLHETLSSESLELMKRKNADYSLGNPFGNFMVCEALQAASAEEGIIIRMSDKLSRLVSVMQKGAQVPESVRDTVLDLINYSVLLYGVRQFKMRASGENQGNEIVSHN